MLLVDAFAQDKLIIAWNILQARASIKDSIDQDGDGKIDEDEPEPKVGLNLHV